MAQPLRTPQGETAKLKLVKVCRECGGPLGPRNEIGVCQQTPECRKVSKRLHARGHAAEAKSKQSYRNCLGCGDQLSLRNTTDYCQVKPDCQHQSDLQYARNRRAKMRAGRTPVSVQLCKNCGDPVRSDNTTGYCGRKPKCRNLRADFCHRRRAEENGEVREKRFCLDCGGVLAWNSSTDICQTNPDCRPHSRRLVQRASRKRQAELRIRRGRQRTCVRCLEPLRSDDITDYCMTNPTCKRIHSRLYQQIRAKRQTRPTCKVCKKTRMRKDSKYGVCERTVKCRKELDRLKNQAKWYRDHDESKSKARTAYRQKHKQRREYANRRNREQHIPAVIPTPTRILPKEFAAVVGIPLDSVYRYCKQPHPALGRRIKTWSETRPPGSRKPFLCALADANKIAAHCLTDASANREHGALWPWGEEEFRFTPNQALCVDVLYRAKQAGSPSVKDDYVLNEAGLTVRLLEVFRDRRKAYHPAWGKMIVRGDSRGTHQIADPPPRGR